jgi:hypothetical protein
MQRKENHKILGMNQLVHNNKGLMEVVEFERAREHGLYNNKQIQVTMIIARRAMTKLLKLRNLILRELTHKRSILTKTRNHDERA